MSVLIKENDLPQELTAEQAVEAAYSSELAEVASKVQRGLRSRKVPKALRPAASRQMRTMPVRGIPAFKSVPDTITIPMSCATQRALQRARKGKAAAKSG